VHAEFEAAQVHIVTTVSATSKPIARFVRRASAPVLLRFAMGRRCGRRGERGTGPNIGAAPFGIGAVKGV
jgi:hypothetical protein